MEWTPTVTFQIQPTITLWTDFEARKLINTAQTKIIKILTLLLILKSSLIK